MPVILSLNLRASYDTKSKHSFRPISLDICKVMYSSVKYIGENEKYEVLTGKCVI